MPALELGVIEVFLLLGTQLRFLFVVLLLTLGIVLVGPDGQALLATNLQHLILEPLEYSYLVKCVLLVLLKRLRGSRHHVGRVGLALARQRTLLLAHVLVDLLLRLVVLRLDHLAACLDPGRFYVELVGRQDHIHHRTLRPRVVGGLVLVWRELLLYGFGKETSAGLDVRLELLLSLRLHRCRARPRGLRAGLLLALREDSSGIDDVLRLAKQLRNVLVDGSTLHHLLTLGVVVGVREELGDALPDIAAVLLQLEQLLLLFLLRASGLVLFLHGLVRR
mmetsp:Transcript_23018/g.44916  ORF Transcript_23018/g.44916 Transcript_23018/m.44916 type:complete len:278 (+) Transcript_23018:297-1130(+)